MALEVVTINSLDELPSRADPGVDIVALHANSDGSFTVVTRATVAESRQAARRWALLGFPTVAVAVLLQLLQVQAKDFDKWLSTAVWLSAVTVPLGAWSALAAGGTQVMPLTRFVRLVGNLAAFGLGFVVIAHFNVAAAIVYAGVVAVALVAWISADQGTREDASPPAERGDVDGLGP